MGMSGAKLVKLLKEHGTGADKLDVGRRVLFDAKAADKVATAEDVLAALIASHGEGHGTIAKAKELIATGSFSGPKAAAFTAPEDEMLAAEEAEKKPKKDKDAK